MGRMQALIVIASPAGTSFSHAMASVAGQALSRGGYTVTAHDLYQEGFDPVQPTGEAANTTSPDPLVEQHCADLAAADLVLVFHPNWWSQPPAILKGWIDRVFRLGTAYAYASGDGYEGIPVGLLKARRALVFNTSNTPREREQAVFGDPLESLWRHSVFGLCGVHDVVRRMYGPMAASSDAQRAQWLRDVGCLVADAIASGRAA
jgi:NAD(P)H dehydrogenase (quinone)